MGLSPQAETLVSQLTWSRTKSPQGPWRCDRENQQPNAGMVEGLMALRATGLVRGGFG
jgi:hypothetical protein